jgi:hypothetical protein
MRAFSNLSGLRKRYDSLLLGAPDGEMPENISLDAEPASFRNMAIKESGGSGSQESITRKRGVRKLSNRICPRPKVVFRNIRPFNHQAGTPGRLNFKTFSTVKPASCPTLIS